MKTRTRTPSTRSAFTLIEMLVVVAIIIVLSGMLIAAVKGSMNKAEKIQCSNNVRQITSALLIYADNNKLKFPANGDSTERVVGSLSLTGTYNGDAVRFGGADPGSNLLLETDGRPLNMYIHQPEVFRCPNDNGSSGALGAASYSCYETHGSSYLYPHDDVGSIFGLAGKKRTTRSLGGASSKILIMEIPFQFNATSSSPPTHMDAWHDSEVLKCLCGFMDGHVEMVEADTSFTTPDVNNAYY